MDAAASKMRTLRNWQQGALNKCLRWLLETRIDRHFLINAAPGAGKTVAACVIADELMKRGEIEQVIVIAPRAEIVNQWSRDFQQITGQFMMKVTGSDSDIVNLDVSFCATWAAVQGLGSAFTTLCQGSKVLVVCDEHHHAAIDAAWGSSADSAFKDAKFVIILTGTPIRSDGQKSVWLAYDDKGAINHPEEGTYTLTYGEAVDLGYCRPVTFHRHEGRFSVDLEDGQHITVSSKEPANLDGSLARIPALQRAVNFYRLACAPLYEKDGQTPLVAGYQGSMIEWGSQKLSDLRDRMPAAGGLIIAPSIEIAEYMAELVELIDREPAIIVHSHMKNPENRIQAFRNTNQRWLVSVGMISEGVDIQRLRVLVYLPNALTELSFRQAIGRIVRTAGPDDDTRGYVVMPSFDILEAYARKVEEEMSPAARKDEQPKSKRCPVCATESPLSASECSACGHIFPVRQADQKTCSNCGHMNPKSAKLCEECKTSFATTFVLSLDEALRTGAIVRGMDIDEDEVQEGEEMAAAVRRKMLASGDDKLIKLVKILPEESWARLKNILNQ
jgi:superfamily II DNA or RNA helicase